MRTRLLLVGVLTSLAASACGTESAGPPLQHRAQSIVGATDSTDAQDAVLYLYGDGSCTAVLVAPNLALTAKHCLLETSSVVTFDCTPGHRDKAQARQRVALEHLRVYRGKEKPLQDLGPVKQVFSSPSLDSCVDDAALLLLEKNVEGIEPLRLRLSDVDKAPPATIGESVLSIGWGLNESGTPVHTRQQRQGTVIAVGQGVYQPPGSFPTQNVDRGQILTNTGVCFGDDGGPVLSLSSNAVIAVAVANIPFDPLQPRPFLDIDAGTSADIVTKYCNASTVLATALRSDAWLFEAFAAAGYAPWREGHDRPSAIGGTCAEDLDCNSGFCFHGGSTAVCSQRCDVGACPSGFECVGQTGARVCAPPVVAAPPGDGVRSGCTAAPTLRSGSASALFAVASLGLGIVAFLRRRRR